MYSRVWKITEVLHRHTQLKAILRRSYMYVAVCNNSNFGRIVNASQSVKLADFTHPTVTYLTAK